MRHRNQFVAEDVAVARFVGAIATSSAPKSASRSSFAASSSSSLTPPVGMAGIRTTRGDGEEEVDAIILDFEPRLDVERSLMLHISVAFLEGVRLGKQKKKQKSK